MDYNNRRSWSTSSMVEQLTLNQQVQGSSPWWITLDIRVDKHNTPRYTRMKAYEYRGLSSLVQFGCSSSFTGVTNSSML